MPIPNAGLDCSLALCGVSELKDCARPVDDVLEAKCRSEGIYGPSRGETGLSSAKRARLEAAPEMLDVREKARAPEIENLPAETPCRLVGDAGVRDGLMGSTNVTEVGKVGDWSAGKDSFLDRRDVGSTVTDNGRGEVICIEDGRVRGATGNGTVSFAGVFTGDVLTNGALGAGTDGAVLSVVKAVCECDRVGVGLDSIDAGAVRGC